MTIEINLWYLIAVVIMSFTGGILLGMALQGLNLVDTRKWVYRP